MWFFSSSDVKFTFREYPMKKTTKIRGLDRMDISITYAI
jgi:hypothetical protein